MHAFLKSALSGRLLTVVRRFNGRATEHVGRWRAVAELCNLTNVEESRRFGMKSELSGSSSGLRVRLTTYIETRDSGTMVLITSVTNDLDWLRLRREDLGTVLQPLVGTPEVEVGDIAFDVQFFVDGPVAIARAVFDAETRDMLRWLTGYVRLEVLDGELRAELPEVFSTDLFPARSSSDSPDILREVAPKLVDAARRLARPADIAERLARNVRHDPQAKVRLECLLLLVAQFPNHPVTDDALVAAGGDDSPEIRLRAAMARGEGGHEILIALAASGPDNCGARAVAALDRRLGLDSARSVLESARRDGRIETARAVVAVLGQPGELAAVRLLVPVLADEHDDLVAAAAHALGLCGLAIAEAPLLDVLGREGPAHVRVAAAEALGHCASPRSVMALKEAEARHRLDWALRRAARHAVIEIQARLTGASPGRLSLTAGESGQLSMASHDESGRLSLPSKPHHCGADQK